MNLDITCKGVEVYAVDSQHNLTIEIKDISMDFLEQICVKEIVKWVDNKKILDQIDPDELWDFVSSHFDVTIKSNERVD